MPLTDVMIRNLKPGDKLKRYSDEKNLYLDVSPKGGKWWRFRYRIGPLQKQISLGVYPTISLKEARIKRDEYNNLVANKIDPSQVRKMKKMELAEDNTFECIALEWHRIQSMTWAKSYSKDTLSRLKKHVFPNLGSKPIMQITTQDIISNFKKLEKEDNLDVLDRMVTVCFNIFELGINLGKLNINPARSVKKVFPKPIKIHRSALLQPKEVGNLLLSLDSYHGTFVIKCALQLIPLTWLRSQELRHGEWSEINFEKKEWIIPIHRMKRTRKDKEAYPKETHLVPLSSQAIFILESLFKVTGKEKLIFPGLKEKDRPITGEALIGALRRMGYSKDEMHIHGFRAMARTMVVEQLNFNSEWSECQLAHKPKDALGTAYNRTTFVPQRHKMMQDWADYLDRLKSGDF